MDKTKDVQTLDDIDALMAKEFNLDVEAPKEEPKEEDTKSEEEVVEPEEKEEEKQEPESTPEESKQDIEEEKPSKPTPEDKKDYSFEKLRKENAEKAQKLKELEDEAEFVKELAAQYGFTDPKEFKKVLKEQTIKKEAIEKGYNEEAYKELIRQREKIAELERVEMERDQETKIKRFGDALDGVLKEFDFKDDVKEVLWERLEAEGYNVDTLLALPKPETVLKGVLLDKIQEKIKNQKIEKAKDIDSIKDEKHETAKGTESVSLDKIIAADMAAWKKQNFYK